MVQATARTVVMASGNAGKLREIERLLAGLDVTVVSQGELGVIDVEETGTTFIENSLLKARNCRRLRSGRRRT
jgi:XTP/dITP diphosphohydrolase